jgi:hypothetical protein
MTKRNLKYGVYYTPFHGGRLVSQHRTLKGAMHKRNKLSSGSCICGCAVVLELDGDELLSVDHNEWQYRQDNTRRKT